MDLVDLYKVRIDVVKNPVSSICEKKKKKLRWLWNPQNSTMEEHREGRLSTIPRLLCICLASQKSLTFGVVNEVCINDPGNMLFR